MRRVRFLSILAVIAIAAPALASCSSDSPKAAKNTPLTNPAPEPTTTTKPLVSSAKPDATALVTIVPLTRPQPTGTTTQEQAITGLYNPPPDWTVDTQHINIKLGGKPSAVLRVTVVNHSVGYFETVGIGALNANGKDATLLPPPVCLSRPIPDSNDYPQCATSTQTFDVSLTSGKYVFMADSNPALNLTINVS